MEKLDAEKLEKDRLEQSRKEALESIPGDSDQAEGMDPPPVGAVLRRTDV